jgi:hypothetical protein
VSDQDFFFDEEEQQEEKPAKSGGSSAKKSDASSKKSAPAKRSSSASASDTPVMERSVSVMIAGLIGVVALLAGVIVGILIPTESSVPGPTATTPGAEQPAPQLSPEQLEGGLPEGHPDLGDMGGEGAVPAPNGGEAIPAPEGEETTEGAQ